MYSFWSLPENFSSLIYGVLDNTYLKGEKKENDEINDFKKANNIPLNSELRTSKITYIINSRKMCEILGDNLHFAFESSQLYVDQNFLPNSRKSNDHFIKNYLRYFDLQAIHKNPDLCKHDWTKTTSAARYYRKKVVERPLNFMQQAFKLVGWQSLSLNYFYELDIINKYG